MGGQEDFKEIMSILGYHVDGTGNVREGINHLGYLELKGFGEEGAINISMADGNLQNDARDLEAAVPVRVNRKYAYFSNDSGTYRVRTDDLVRNIMLALGEEISGDDVSVQ